MSSIQIFFHFPIVDFFYILCLTSMNVLSNSVIFSRFCTFPSSNAFHSSLLTFNFTFHFSLFASHFSLSRTLSITKCFNTSSLCTLSYLTLLDIVFFFIFTMNSDRNRSLRSAVQCNFLYYYL